MRSAINTMMKAFTISSSLLLVLFCLARSSSAASSGGGESPFLKEILYGRCYELPPTNNVDDCPFTVASFMSILESKKDADIEMKDFDEYLETADFSSPPNGALIWQSFMGSNNDESLAFLSPPTNLVTLEDTPGGAFARNVVFCGIDQRENCSIETSNAYWKFWQASLNKFASLVRGELQIVVEPKADVVFLQHALASALARDDNDVTSIILHAMQGCNTQAITSLLKSLEDSAIPDVQCKEDMVEFMICQDVKSKECTNYLKARDEIMVDTNEDGGDNTQQENGDNAQQEDKDSSTAMVQDSSTISTTNEVASNRHVNFVKLFIFCGVVIGAISFLLHKKRFLGGYLSVSDDDNKYHGSMADRLPTQ